MKQLIISTMFVIVTAMAFSQSKTPAPVAKPDSSMYSFTESEIAPVFVKLNIIQSGQKMSVDEALDFVRVLSVFQNKIQLMYNQKHPQGHPVQQPPAKDRPKK